jgi:MFS family permease
MEPEIRRKLEKNLRLYRWYQAFREPIFWGPIIILYSYSVGKMSVADVFFMEGVTVFFMALLQVPTGAMADIFGRKKLVIAGSLGMFLGAILFALIEKPLDVWIANFVFMIGVVLSTGADSSLIYDSLKKTNGDYKLKSMAIRIEGGAHSKRLLLFAILMPLSGFLYEINPRLPMIFSIPGMAISSIVVFFFWEDRNSEEEVQRLKLKEVLMKHVVTMRQGILEIFRQKNLRWVVSFIVIIEVSSKVWFFNYNPYFEIVGMNITSFGMMFSVFNLVAWYFSEHAHSIEAKMKEENVAKMLFYFIGVPMILMGAIVNIYSCFLIVFQNAVRGFVRPFFFSIQNHYVKEEVRATTDSAKQMAVMIVQSLGLMSYKFILERNSLPNSMMFWGIGVTIIAIPMYLWYRKVFRR